MIEFDQIDFGEFKDNWAALEVGRYLIENGERQSGIRMLEELGEHIRSTGEPVCIRNLLPIIEKVLATADGELTQSTNSQVRNTMKVHMSMVTNRIYRSFAVIAIVLIMVVPTLTIFSLAGYEFANV